MTAPSLVRATRVIGARNVLRLRRSPDLIAVVAVQPVLFVLLFGFVLGGAIQVPAGDYQAFLVTGVLVQTVVFGSALAGIGMAEDLERGVVDRFRSLPVPRASIVIARVLSQQITGALGISVTVEAAGCSCSGVPTGARGVAGRVRAADALRPGDELGQRHDRMRRPLDRGGAGGLLRLALPGDLRVRRVRPDGPDGDARTTDRGVEPDERGHHHGARPSRRRRPGGRMGWPQEHALMLALGWCAVLIATFLPWSVHVYQRRTAGWSRPTSAGRA